MLNSMPVATDLVKKGIAKAGWSLAHILVLLQEVFYTNKRI